MRTTYWIATGRRVVFVKTRMRQDREVERARRTLTMCITDEHATEGDEQR